MEGWRSSVSQHQAEKRRPGRSSPWQPQEVPPQTGSSRCVRKPQWSSSRRERFRNFLPDSFPMDTTNRSVGAFVHNSGECFVAWTPRRRARGAGAYNHNTFHLCSLTSPLGSPLRTAAGVAIGG